MFRIRKAPLIAVIALASLFVSAPAASAMVAGPHVVIRGGFYGPGWGWGWMAPVGMAPLGMVLVGMAGGGLATITTVPTLAK